MNSLSNLLILFCLVALCLSEHPFQHKTGKKGEKAPLHPASSSEKQSINNVFLHPINKNRKPDCSLHASCISKCALTSKDCDTACAMHKCVGESNSSPFTHLLKDYQQRSKGAQHIFNKIRDFGLRSVYPVRSNEAEK